jgi:hypothetical protein
VDATGVGPPVVDLLTQAQLNPIAVTITGGDQVAREGRRYRVPKRDLVSTVQIALQSGRLKVAQALPEANTLVKEMLAFKVRIIAAANDTYGAWREGEHDDLVLAVCMAVWFGEHGERFRFWFEPEPDDPAIGDLEDIAPPLWSVGRSYW